MYWISLPAMYSMLFAIIYYNINETKFLLKHYIIFWVLILSVLISVSSNLIVVEMIYDEILLIHYEKFWILFNFYYLFYLAFPVLWTIFYFIKIKQLNTIHKIRFKIIFTWYLIFAFLYIFFLWILPNIGIWILQKEQILFFIPFVWLSFYSLKRYHFSNIKISLWKILIFILSIFWSITFINIIKNYFLSLNSDLINFWWIIKNFQVTELILWIILFLITYKFLNKIFLWNTHISTFEKDLWNLKKEIPYITNFSDLSQFLENKCYQLCKIKYVEIKLLSNKTKFNEFKKFFNDDGLNDIFINDIVFIEENKNKFSKNKLLKEVHPESYLIFPLYNNTGTLMWTFNIWKKPFNDTFYSEEIIIIKDFIWFISGHLKYLRIYDRINDLNINLDKAVDKKTMQYNALINKQKDFISLISHEIKSPIGSAIFQIDCILDDVKDNEYNKEYLEKELWLLNQQLLKSWNLAKKLFSVQQYDLSKIELLKEEVKLNDLLTTEIKVLNKKHKDIKFKVDLNNNIWFVKLDKVQFTQVIENLLNNAIKFSKKKNWDSKIVVFSYIKADNIIIEIEDNWEEFKHTNIENLFDKYNTWTWSSKWLWMGLYLCKKIIELHNWSIKAKKSKNLGGAMFIIKLPR